MLCDIFTVLIVFQMVSFIKTIHWICGNKKAASVSKGRIASIISQMFYGFGFACGAGGGVGLAWLAAASTIRRALL